MPKTMAPKSLADPASPLLFPEPMLAMTNPLFLDPNLPQEQGLYSPAREHDACGVGFVADMHNRKSHEIIAMGLKILLNLDHRGAV
ncbi:MAG TPA: hypothetical protein VEQ35_08100, partial [Beijerinckia sp.]|nr:hypothetical protein [Beijerinckia sp.]